MIRLSLLLLGTEFARHNWRFLLAAGVTWLAIGIAVVIDGFDGVLYFPLHLFAGLLLIEGAVAFTVSVSGEYPTGVRPQPLACRMSSATESLHA